MPTVYRKCTHALIQRAIGDEDVLLNTQSGNVHQLNPSATCIWRRMADDMDIEAIAAVLVENFAIDAETALADAQSFVTELSNLKLLEKIE
jgi:hypothetical protein